MTICLVILVSISYGSGDTIDILAIATNMKPYNIPTIVYDKTFKGENFCGFHKLQVSLKNFLLHN